MDASLPITPRRFHLARLMSICRSAGRPCRDAVELDPVAAGWATIVEDASGHQTIRLTNSGIQLVAAARQRNQRALSAHDQLAGRVCAHLIATGRIVWRELSLRARVDAAPSASKDAARMIEEALWLDDAGVDIGPQEHHQAKATWRMARPDVFSVRS